MDFLSQPLGWIMPLIAVVGALGVLHTIAAHLQHERRIHELRIRVNELRQAQAERLRKLAEEAASVHVEVVGGDGGERPPHGK